MKRPVGITVLGVLAIIGGVIGIVASLPLLGISTMAIAGFSGTAAGLAGGAMMFYGVVLLALSIVQLAFGIAAMSLRSWSWVLGVIVSGVGVVLGIAQLFSVGITGSVVVSLAIYAIVLSYLYSHDVRAAFGHEDGSLFHTSGQTPMGAA